MKKIVNPLLSHKLIFIASLLLLLASITFAASRCAPASGQALFSFQGRNGLIVSEYSYWNPQGSTNNTPWELSSGSLFRRDGHAWTGKPDDGCGLSKAKPRPNWCNRSAIFRLITRQKSWRDVAVSFRLLNIDLTHTPKTPAVAWDGVHIFLRYQSEYNLYYASVNRRDSQIVIKKKCPGGKENGGTYYQLAATNTPYPIPFGHWQEMRVEVTNTLKGVQISVYAGGRLRIQATDNGVGCPMINEPGRVGIRGDNDNFMFGDFRVSNL